MNTTTFVLDMGTSKVSAAAFEMDATGTLKLRGYASSKSSGLTKGALTNLDEVITGVQTTVSELRRQVGTIAEEFVVNINGSHVESSNTQGLVPIYPGTRTITRDDVLQVLNHSRQVLPAADREQIQAIPREFRIDGQKGVMRPIGMNGSRLEVVTHLVTGLSAQVQNIHKVMRIANLKVLDIVPAPLASGLGVVDPQLAESGCVVVDIGAGTTTLAIFTAGVIAYSAVIPIGSAMVTSDLSKLLKTSLEEAERLKIEDASALSKVITETDFVQVLQLGQSSSRNLQRRVLCEIVESRMREIFALVKAHIEKSGLNGMLPGGIILTGGGSALPSLPTLCEDVMKHMTTRCGRPELAGTVVKEFAQPANAALLGMAMFTFPSDEEEFAPISGLESWKVRINNVIGKLKSKG